jgi:serine/threonine-protein kinase
MKTRQKVGKENDKAHQTPKQREPLSERITTIGKDSLVRTCEGTYRILEQVGRGGMGDVYKGVNQKTGDVVAVKTIGPMEDMTMGRRMFEREAKLGVSVNHPNVMRTLDFGFHEDDPFIVMEYFEGKNLHEIVKGSQSLPWQWLGPVMVQVCDGLHAIHEEGIMHRHLTGSNVMVAMEDGEGDRETWEVLRAVTGAKVLDFGLAKKIQDEGKEELTRTGVFVGTLDYVAPEQLQKGRGDGVVLDHCVDIYSLGVAMYRSLTGQFPFGEGFDGLMERLDQMPPPPSSLNPGITRGVDAVILKAMATQPEDRYQSAMDLRAAIADSL